MNFANPKPPRKMKVPPVHEPKGGMGEHPFGGTNVVGGDLPRHVHPFGKFTKPKMNKPRTHRRF